MNGLIGREGDPSLSEHERKICLLNSFEGECMNGGWDQYLYNSSGDYAEELQPFLREFGYQQILKGFALIRSAMGGQIPKDRDERIMKLDALSEELKDVISELVSEESTEIWAALDDYIQAHPTYF